MHKLDKYCRRFTDDFIESTRSRYYKINNHILRISDHIGMSSSGLFSIIIKGNQFILHHPNSGSVEILNYEGVKAFVKIFAKFPMGNMAMLSQWQVNKNEQLINSVKEDTTKTIFGIESHHYTKGEKKLINECIAHAKHRKDLALNTI